MEIILASGNEHKRKEFQLLFPEHKIWLPKEKNLVFEVEETGETFIENALQKANGLKKQNPNNKIPILADDSGILVKALPGELGIKTARFGQKADGTILSSTDRNALLLKRMKNIKDRTAYFVCTLAFILSENEIFIVEENVSGHIIEETLGSEGFGYDPVFWVDKANCTMAQLSPGKKNIYSHRAKASEKLKLLIK